jgi:hypothetical protein
MISQGQTQKTELIEWLGGMRLHYGTGNQIHIGLDFLASLLAEREARITPRSSHPRDYSSRRVAREGAKTRRFLIRRFSNLLAEDGHTLQQ